MRKSDGREAMESDESSGGHDMVVGCGDAGGL